MINIAQDLTTALKLYSEDPAERRKEFYRYYSEKRVAHQFMQVEMLKGIDRFNLCEIGSYLGFATALFMAAGFRVKTIDAGPKEVLGELKTESHIEKNVLDVTESDLSGQDVIVCCETLEHLQFEEARRVVEMFHKSDADWLLVSVPYHCPSADVRLQSNPIRSLLRWNVKLPQKFFKEFVPDTDPFGHKWELGYKGFPKKRLLKMLESSGYKVRKQNYVGTVRSLFVLCSKSDA